jgi:hypothetical protein
MAKLAVFGGMFPILPGKEERAKNLGNEVEPHLAEWNRLSEEGTFHYYNALVQELPSGWHACYSMGVEDPTKVRGSFGDTDHDKWWKGYMLDVHGIDFDNMPADAPSGPPAATALAWQKPS